MQANNSDDTSKKKYFVFKLIHHRPSFAEDMTEEERDIMKQHVVYWTENAEKRIAIVFGPVLDPKGIYGLGIIETENEDQAHISLQRIQRSNLDFKDWKSIRCAQLCANRSSRSGHRSCGLP